MFHTDTNTVLIQSLKSTANDAAEAQLIPAANTAQLSLPAANTTQLSLPAANTAELSLPTANTTQFSLPTVDTEKDQGWIPRFIHPARDEVSAITTQIARHASRTKAARDPESIIRAVAAQLKTKGN